MNRTTPLLKSLWLLPLLSMLGGPAYAGFIQIDVTATISNDGGSTTDDITAQFILDSDVLFSIDTGAISGVIESASATLFGAAETVDAGSDFTLVSAANRPGFGVLTLIGDYGPLSNFSLDLASTAFFSTNNVFDDLLDTLQLSSLLDFSPAEALGTTRFSNLFVNNLGQIEEWEGAITSLSIRAVPEPAILWLFLVAAMPGIAVWRRN